VTSQPTFTFRHPTPDDAQAIVDLSNAGDIAATGQPQTDLAQIRDMWNEPYFDLNRDAWVAETPDGRLAGYIECYYQPGEEDIGLFYYLDPNYAGTGLEALLLQRGEDHVPELLPAIPPDQPIELLTAYYGTETEGHRLVEANGYSVARYFYRMEASFDAPPPVPDQPGVTIRAYDPDRDAYGLYDALEESFEDHWRHNRVSFEDWQRTKIQSDAYDPAAWVVAEVDGQIVGGAVCTHCADVPWVRMLGVRREWRQRGIARAVLLAIFTIFYARGDRRVGLGVDASSPTGATRLYESAGMRVSDQRVVYTKPIAR